MIKIKSRIDIIQEAEKEFNFTAPIAYKEKTKLCARMEEKWINLNSLMKYIDDSRNNGNLVGEKGFSAALFLSQLIKKLEREVTE